MKPALALGVPVAVLLTLVLLPPAAACDAEPSTPETRPGQKSPSRRPDCLQVPPARRTRPALIPASSLLPNGGVTTPMSGCAPTCSPGLATPPLRWIYGEGQVADTPKAAAQLDGLLNANQQEMTARVLAHLKFLAAHPEVDPGKVAAIGYGSGGDVCLQMARNGMRGLDGVVAFHPFFRVRPSNPPMRKATARVMVCDAREDPYVHLSGGKVEAWRRRWPA